MAHLLKVDDFELNRGGGSAVPKAQGALNAYRHHVLLRSGTGNPAWAGLANPRVNAIVLDVVGADLLMSEPEDSGMLQELPASVHDALTNSLQHALTNFAQEC